MPISKNRKGHDKKAAFRKQRIREQRNRLEKLYKEMSFQLKDKNTSVPDMLNKEEAGPPNGPEQTTIDTKPFTVVDALPLVEPVQIVSQSPVPTPEEKAEQDAIQASIITTTTP